LAAAALPAFALQLYIFLSLDTVFALGLEVYAMITFVSAVVARAYGALHCLDIYVIVVKKIPRSFNDRLDSMILVQINAMIK